MYICNMVRCFLYLCFIAMFVFASCGGKEEKERARVEKEREAAKEDSPRKIRMVHNDSMQKYNLRKDGNFQKSVDSVLKHVSDSFETACKKDSDCRKKQYEAIKRGLEGCKKDSVCFKEAYEKRKFKLKEWE
jgi:hypothetical protein